MGHEFDTPYWDQHWAGTRPAGPPPPHPYLARELAGLTPGTALDAGSGEGSEATWLATHGWDVTAVDLSAEVLARAAARPDDTARRVRWVEADLTTWQPRTPFDLVTTHYVHTATAPTAFYARLAGWVAPGGTLLVVAHRHDGIGDRHHTHDPHDSHTHGDHAGPPAVASVALADITDALDPTVWDVVTAEEPDRTLTRHGRAVVLRDVVVRARHVSRTHPTEQKRTAP